MPLPPADLDAATVALAPDWAALRGARLFISGGTGFIGGWLLATLHHASTRLGLDCEVVLLTRDPAAFAARARALAAWPALATLAGDVTAPINAPGPFTHIVHAATEASAALNARAPLAMFHTIVEGTRRVLELAAANPGARLLNLSSGAVYGAQPWDLTHVPETHRGGPDPTDPRAAYAEGKRAAEMLCALHAHAGGPAVTTARIFAVLGPGLPLGTHFAAGNFIADAIAGRPPTVEGAGTAVRSYLYAADLAVWLWRMLARARAGSTYNVGSPEAVSIAELAQRTATVLGAPAARVLGRPDPGWNPGRYVPDVTSIARDLGCVPTIGLDDAIRRTASWHGWRA